jgi:hypothetical protein
MALLQPKINENLSKWGNRYSRGWIRSTQVTGLSAIVGGESGSNEPFTFEVESKEKWSTRLKANADYHPEDERASPWDYRLSAEYQPPFREWMTDSVWVDRLENRLNLEASVETRTELRDQFEDRRVERRAGWRYRYRFWDLW